MPYIKVYKQGGSLRSPLLHMIVVFWHQLGIHEIADMYMYVLNKLKSQLNTVPLSDYSYEGMAGHC